MLLVCRTCPRYDNHRSGEFSKALENAFADDPATAGIEVRFVQCLGGCPRDGVVAVDGPGKARVRFSGLAPEDAEAIVQAARAHAACVSGAPGDWEIPSELAGRVSSVTLKRAPR